MNVLLSTDLEGISCVDNPNAMTRANPQAYSDACQRLMHDVNAAVEGCLDAGAKNIYVLDGHGSGKNFIAEMLHPRAVHLGGTEWEDIIKSGKIDAYLQVGCHTMAGVINGFLDHTQCSGTWYNYFVNGRRSGEIAQGAIFVGAYDIPFVMVSGDDAACAEARQFLGDIAVAAVKQGIGRNRARCLPSEEALQLIRTAAAEGLRRCNEIKPYKVFLPAEIKLELSRSDYCDALVNNNDKVERVDARTVRKVIDRIEYYRDILF